MKVKKSPANEKSEEENAGARGNEVRGIIEADKMTTTMGTVFHLQGFHCFNSIKKINFKWEQFISGTSPGYGEI